MTTRIEKRPLDVTPPTPDARPTASLRPLQAVADVFSPAAKTASPAKAVAAPPPPATQSLLRVSPLGKLFQAPAAAAPPAVQQKAKSELSNVRSPEQLANTLNHEKDPQVRDEIVRQAVTSRNGPTLLTNVSPGVGAGAVNQGFDTMKTIADAVGHAYQSGAINGQNLKDFEKKLGQDGAELFVQQVAISGGNTGKGGVVEALGTQAKALGYHRAASLAFTSSDALISADLPKASDQQAAFNDVKSYLNQVGPSVQGTKFPETVNAAELALLSASRLTARGNGFTPTQLDQELKTFGPQAVGEAIARAAQSPGDGNVPGALDTLGKAAYGLGHSDPKNAEAWSTDWALAVTASPQLIKADLGGDGNQLEALSKLDTFLSKNRSEWASANGDVPYTLLRLPQAVDAINRLLAGNPALLTPLLNSRSNTGPGPKGAQGDALVVELFESITLNPDVPQAQRDQLTKTIDSYTSNQWKNAGSNSPQAGRDVGRLLGLLQVASNRVVGSGSDGGGDGARGLALDFTQKLLSGAAGAALDSTGPIGSVVGGAVFDQVLDGLFSHFGAKSPSPNDVTNAVVQNLTAAGVNVSYGEVAYDQLQDLFMNTQSTLDQLSAQAAGNPTRFDALQGQLDQVSQVLTGLTAGFNDELNSSKGEGQLLHDQLASNQDQP